MFDIFYTVWVAFRGILNSIYRFFSAINYHHARYEKGVSLTTLGRIASRHETWVNKWGFRPPVCTYRLNWAKRTSWGLWYECVETALHTQDRKFECWTTLPLGHRGSPQYWIFASESKLSLKPECCGRIRDLRFAGRQAALTTLGLMPQTWDRWLQNEIVRPIHVFIVLKVLNLPHYILHYLTDCLALTARGGGGGGMTSKQVRFWR